MKPSNHVIWFSQCWAREKWLRIGALIIRRDEGKSISDNMDFHLEQAPNIWWWLMLWVEKDSEAELRLWKPTGHRFAIPDLGISSSLSISDAGFLKVSPPGHICSPKLSCWILYSGRVISPQLIKEKETNCFLWKALGEIISHLQDRDNGRRNKWTLYGPAVRDWAAGWIGVTPCLCFPGGQIFLPCSCSETCLPPFFLP